MGATVVTIRVRRIVYTLQRRQKLWGRAAGKTYEDGKVHLVHPEAWKKGRKYNSERQWVNAVYHEMGHYVFWVDAERKADTFALRMENGLANGRNGAARALARTPRNGRRAA